MANGPPIHITNVMPPHNSGTSAIPAWGGGVLDSSQLARTPKQLNIPDTRDVAISNYTECQQARVQDEGWKQEFVKASEALLKTGWDLEQIYHDQKLELLVENGVLSGIAKRCVDDIPVWCNGYTYDNRSVEFS